MTTRLVCAFAMLAGCSGDAAVAQVAQRDASDLVQLAHSDLARHGDGGEGMALQQLGARRLLYIAHEGQTTCLSVVDVTDASAPALVAQLPSPGPGVTRCNSLGLANGVLAVANQTLNVGQQPAGMWLLDVSDLERVKRAHSLDDLRLAFFDTSGPHSRGVHWLWFADGEVAHLATGAADFEPTNASDHQFYMAVDVRDPRAPRELGRWWLPGTRVGDACLPGCLPARQAIDDGYRAHSIEIDPRHRDRAYVGYIDGGMLILDISRPAEPRLVSRLDYGPPYPAWTHTVQPLGDRKLAVVSDEAVRDHCADGPKLVWLVDIRDEQHPTIIGTAPQPANVAALCKRPGRFGAHNVAPALALRHTVVGTFFNGGVRVYHVADSAVPGAPPALEELAYFIPQAPPGNHGVVAINHAIVADNLIYAVDRITGGLYILRYTGRVPLD